MAKHSNEKQFVEAIQTKKKPNKIDFDKDEEKIFADKKMLIREGCYLLGFLDSLMIFLNMRQY